MASLIRIGFTRILNGKSNNSISSKNILQIGLRCISGKSTRTQPPKPKPKPWPYNQRHYNILHYLFDSTTARIDENSKVVVVEGSVAAGKTKFAKELADELEMFYFPEANLDMWYTNDYGYNLKQLDEQVPEGCRSFDINNFLLNPKHTLAANFQLLQYAVKYSQYIDALAHLLSTGQGVVLDRSVYSDFVFLEAMYSQGYISKAARSAYYEIRDNSLGELLKPHVIIYLDVPVSKIQQKIQQRKLSCELNSPVLSEKYLSVLEKHYKQEYLKEASQHSELLVYDWSNEGEVEIVVEDIERIHFEQQDYEDKKFKDWAFEDRNAWNRTRNLYADQKDYLMTFRNVPRFDVPELITSAADADTYKLILEDAPGEKYMKGYNTSMGDSPYYFRNTLRNRDTLPLIERKLE